MLDSAAKRLDVTPDKLRDALAAAQDEQLDAAVKAGTLTQKQADAMKAARKQSGHVLGGGRMLQAACRARTGRHGMRGPGRPGFGLRGGPFDGLAKALGIDADKLHEQLRDGTSIAAIAKAKGKSLADVKASLKAATKTKLDKAVKDEDLTRKQADAMLAELRQALRRARLGQAAAPARRQAPRRQAARGRAEAGLVPARRAGCAAACRTSRRRPTASSSDRRAPHPRRAGPPPSARPAVASAARSSQQASQRSCRQCPHARPTASAAAAPRPRRRRRAEHRRRRLMALRFQGFAVESAGTGRDALAAVRSFDPHLMVLDIMLPDMEGFEVAERLGAQRAQVPIIFLTARDATQDKIRGLTSGGDDYVTKPFSLEELVARIRVILRRTGAASPSSSRLTFEDLELDEDTREVTRAGQPIELTATEYRLLRYLLLNPRRVLTRAQLLDHVWEYDFDGDSRILETYVSYLRKKLDPHGPSLIQTVRGVGYALRLPRG